MQVKTCNLNRSKILNATQLKIIATAIMLLDHIYSKLHDIYFIPIEFKIIGRIAFPIFFYLLLDSYYYTSNKKKFKNRLLIAATIMKFINLFLNINNNIFETMFITVALIELIENYNKYKTNIIYYILLITLILLSIKAEYGILFITLIILMYFTKKNKKLQYSIYVIFSFMYIGTIQFFMILALPFFMIYNNKKGKGYKKFFYYFYPIHIYLLQIIRLVII